MFALSIFLKKTHTSRSDIQTPSLASNLFIYIYRSVTVSIDKTTESVFLPDSRIRSWRGSKIMPRHETGGRKHPNSMCHPKFSQTLPSSLNNLILRVSRLSLIRYGSNIGIFIYK